MNSKRLYLNVFALSLVIIAAFFLMLFNIKGTNVAEINSSKNLPMILIDNSTSIVDSFNGNWYGNVLGIIEFDQRWRVYYRNRGDNRTEFVESDNLTTWSDPVYTNIPEGTYLFRDQKGEVICYRGLGESMMLYDRFDGMEGCKRELGMAYEWKIDGSVSMAYINGEYLSVGRIRGVGDIDNGRWRRDELAKYPDKTGFPEIEDVFENYPNYDVNDFLKDMRGISVHKSTDLKEWNIEYRFNPKNQTGKSFKGWREKNEIGIADFYSSTPVGNGRFLVKVFKKDKSRLVDRSEYDEDFTTDVQRRFRFTGETVVLPAVIDKGELNIVSEKSVLPYDYHARKAHPDIDWASRPNVEEWGQVTPANRLIELNDFVYIFYQYRDDVHYETLPNPGYNHYSGIFMYRISKQKFDSLFHPSE